MSDAGKSKKVKFTDVVGKTYDMGRYGELEIVEILGGKNVRVKFKNTGYVTTVRYSTILVKGVKDRLSPTLFSVGFVGDKYPTHTKNGATREYNIWHEMLKRCYYEKYKKDHPTYVQCSVSENFKSYTYFYEWLHEQVGFENVGWHLDKDLLMRGNKIYSEDACVFVPQEINKMTKKSNAISGEFPIGVTKSGNKYLARVNIFGGRVRVGLFLTPTEAFQAYKKAKEDHIKSVANLYKTQIDNRLYTALMSYNVDIND